MATLTFADPFLPADFSVDRETLRGFVKRLRYPLAEVGQFLRFFGVGEYGDREDRTRRPHYHIIMFGVTLSDLRDPERTQGDFLQYRSPLLESCWTDPASGDLRGRVRVSYADRSSFSYCAGYVHKKLGGPKAAVEYERIHPVTGLVCQVQPEFALMSRRPGIGGDWFERFADTDARSSYVISRGRKTAMPLYYRRKVQELDHKRAQDVGTVEARRAHEVREHVERIERVAEADAELARHAEDLTPERLEVREEVHRLRTKDLARGGS